MPLDLSRTYFKSMEKLENKEALNSIECISFPHLKTKKDRVSIIKKYTDEEANKKKVVSFEEAARMINGK